MQTDYTFLTDHSYSIRLDNDKLPLKQREMKNKKRRGTSNRSNKTHTVAIHRSSSDKENNSSSLTDASIATGNTLGNKNKSSTKKKTTASRTQSGKKPNVKSTQGRIIKKKKSIIKPLDSHSFDIPASLSIEERVKLRRTKPFLTPPKPVLYPKLKSVKQMHLSKTKKTIIKPKKFFLGSGLDLDNIVPGNRQRRSVQT